MCALVEGTAGQVLNYPSQQGSESYATIVCCHTNFYLGVKTTLAVKDKPIPVDFASQILKSFKSLRFPPQAKTKHQPNIYCVHLYLELFLSQCTVLPPSAPVSCVHTGTNLGKDSPMG